jgi:hypothetical protein
MDQDMGLDNMMKTLLNAVDSLSAQLPTMTAEATAGADPETSAMLSNLQNMMKMNIANLKTMINTNSTGVKMASMPGIVPTQRSFRNTDNDGIPSAEDLMNGCTY